MPLAIRQNAEDRPRGRPTAARANAIADAVYDAALAIFAEQGFQAATMEMIATRAGVSKPTVYSRFAGKDELFAAVMRRQMDRLTAFSEARRTAAGADLQAMLHQEARVLIDALRQPDYRALERLLQSVSFHFPELARQWETGAFRPFADRLAGDMRDCAARAGLPPCDFVRWQHLARMFIHSIASWHRIEVLAREVSKQDIDPFAATVIEAIVAWAKHQEENA